MAVRVPRSITTHTHLLPFTAVEGAPSAEGAVVVVSHDRYFVDRYAATRWEIREERPGRRRLVVERGIGA